MPELQGGQFGLSTWSGRTVTEPRFERVTRFRQGRAAAMVEGRWGIIDRDGDWIHPATLDWVHPQLYAAGPVLVSKDGLYGYLDPQGDWVLPAQYEQASPFHEGFACVRDPQAMRSGLVDAEGLPLTGFRFDECDPAFSDGRARVRLGDRWGFVEPSGELVISLRFDRAQPFSEGLAFVHEAGLTSYIDPKGHRRIPATVEAAGPFREGRAWLRYGADQVGFIDRKGAVVSEPRWREAQDMCEGRAWVRDPKTNLWGAIDVSGRLVIPPEFEDPAPFHDGLARVARDGSYGLIDPKGQEVVPIRYAQLGELSEDRISFSTRQGGAVGVLLRDGKVLVPERYAQISSFQNGLALATRCEWEQRAVGRQRERCEVLYLDRDGRERRRSR